MTRAAADINVKELMLAVQQQKVGRPSCGAALLCCTCNAPTASSLPGVQGSKQYLLIEVQLASHASNMKGPQDDNRGVVRTEY